MDPSEMAKRVSQAQTDLTDMKAMLRQLTTRLDRQALVIQTLKDMLLAGRADGENDFLARLAKLTQAAVEKGEGKVCGKCGKAMSLKHTRCMYCGEPRPPELV